MRRKLDRQAYEISKTIKDDTVETRHLLEDAHTTIGNLIRVFLGFLGIIAVVMVLLGGFKWMTASGNEDKVSEAKRLLIAGVIGLAIILSAFAITSFVIDSVITASAG